MIQIIYYILLLITLIYAFYFLITSFWGFKKYKSDFKNHKAKTKFAVLIAARNEENVIANLIKSLKKQNYPEELYSINVIVNNCTDNTEGVAKDAGANIINCTVPVKSKGDVLKFTFAKLINKKEIDAFVIFDADNVVDPNFLSEMNNAVVEGARVAEGFRDSKNISDNWLSGSYTLFYYIQNIFYNKARRNLGLSASINGTGFMVLKDVIKKHGFNPVTLTEDVEFTAMCALNNEKIHFVDRAVTYDEQPIKFSDSWTQRKRWSKGIMQCMKTYNSKLFKNFVENKSYRSLDMFMVFLAPYIQLLSFALFALLIVFKAMGVELSDIFSYMFAYGLFFFVLTYLVNLLVNLYVYYTNNKKLEDVYSGIFLFTIFIVSWVPINIVCFLKKDIKWDHIKHGRNVDLDKLIGD